MPRRKVNPKKSEIITLPILVEQLSLKELHNRVIIETNSKKGRSLEQKIIALKILMLNDMQYTKTAEEVGVTKKTLWLWWKEYGNMMTMVNPSQEIAQRVENDLAGLMHDVFEASRATVKKMKEMVDKANNIRDLRSVSDSLRAYTELIKIEAEKNKTVLSGNVADFYMNIFNSQINNKYGNTG